LVRGIENQGRDSNRENERELLLSCCRKEPGAWERFLSQYNRLIYYSIHRTCALNHYSPVSEELEDLFNDVLVHLIKDDCKKLRQYRGDGGATVATWIRTITVRFVIDYLRQRSRTGDLVNIDGEEVALEVSLENPVSRPDEDYEEREEQRLFLEAISNLADNDRYFIELYYGRELSPEKAAQILGISKKTVYTRINRLKAKIIKEIVKKGR